MLGRGGSSVMKVPELIETVAGPRDPDDVLTRLSDFGIEDEDPLGV
jgi:hypothetical protein